MVTMDVGVLQPMVLSYKWEINHLSIKSAAIEECFLSPIFSTKLHNNNVEWRLRLYPKSNKRGLENYLSIFVEYLGESEVKAQITFSILNFENKRIFKRVMKNRLFNEKSKSWGFTKFKNYNSMFYEENNEFGNDTLKILCEVNFNLTVAMAEPFIITKSINSEKKDEESNYRLKEFDDFQKLLETEVFNDVTFIVQEKKILAHKAILVTRSPVFQAMFCNYINQKQENVFEITDIKYEVMKELLRFIYVGKINNIDQLGADLLIAADKYSIDGLKILCGKILYEQLTNVNAVEYLNLAVNCNVPILKAQIIEFIANNLEDIVDKPEFEFFGNLNSKVICEVVRAISRKSVNQ
ncbi:protein roadkill-like [Phymastichus coffea]|uniref:protein roadkill-like n=1 Tax=Phymastichus coffea TaxID=108790 RepID=UPI00273B86A8|nr:protein roadkill-like [Phymastichus coffea]XP_058808525.1 protein roadkill-like [Phymastichus coffea]XP_058808526.1 protein roadkill-like [Phymastichus coffea]XP_058808527.1 protein roadkill-like [Phymastichus coffea]